MPKINPAVEASYKEFLKEAEQSPEYQLLAEGGPQEAEILSCYQELMWQAFICGLQVSRQHGDIFEITCVRCGNTITQTVAGSVITMRLAEHEGWSVKEAGWICCDCT
jgi:hypothetical protein